MVYYGILYYGVSAGSAENGNYVAIYNLRRGN